MKNTHTDFILASLFLCFICLSSPAQTASSAKTQLLEGAVEVEKTLARLSQRTRHPIIKVFSEVHENLTEGDDNRAIGNSAFCCPQVSVGNKPICCSRAAHEHLCTCYEMHQPRPSRKTCRSNTLKKKCLLSLMFTRKCCPFDRAALQSKVQVLASKIPLC